EHAVGDPRIQLITLGRNLGCGGAIAHAYEWARDRGVDIAVSIDGDGQMDPDDMGALIMPIIEGRADLTKGNRLTQPSDLKRIPKLRLFGNVSLSVLTKIASGYWTIADSQTGYTAAGRHALEHIDWDKLYARYGRPNDLLVRANVARCRAADVPVRAVYGVGEQSTMRIARTSLSIAWMLFRRFWWRLWTRHVLLEFHPMVFLYLLGVVGTLVTTGLGVHVLRSLLMDGSLPRIASVAWVVMGVTTVNALFLAFWMDLLTNQALSLPLQTRRMSRMAPVQLGEPVATAGAGAPDGA
ncbi:MAG TPA: glycosyltransferase, partial [Nitriliruptorales bacterium]